MLLPQICDLYQSSNMDWDQPNTGFFFINYTTVGKLLFVGPTEKSGSLCNCTINHVINVSLWLKSPDTNFCIKSSLYGYNLFFFKIVWNFLIEIPISLLKCLIEDWEFNWIYANTYKFLKDDSIRTK